MAASIKASATALKRLSTAPGLGFLFLYTSTNPAQQIIDKMDEISRSGEKLGCMWLGPNRLVMATHPDTAKEIIVKHNVFKKRGSEQYQQDSPLSSFYVNNGKQVPELVTANGEVWKSQRKHFNPAFAITALEKLIPMFCDEADIFLKNCVKENFNVADATSHYALDCLGNAVLGQSFHAQEGEFQETYDAYLTVMQAFGNPIFQTFPSVFKLPLKSLNKVKDSVHTMRSLLDHAVEKKVRERQGCLSVDAKDEPMNLLDIIIDAAEKNEDFPRESITANLWTFFIAGHDTTATSLAWLINMLSHKPEIQSKVRNEINEVLGESIIPSREQLDNLIYLDAVLKENLRMNPPIHNLLTRTAAEDTELGGYFIPKDTGVSIAIQAVNRHPDFWENPNEFSPERFLTGKRRDYDLFSWMPFSVGPRRCIGEKFSILEQKCLLSKILRKFRICPSDPVAIKHRLDLPLSNSTFAMMFKAPSAFTAEFKPLDEARLD